MTWLEKNSDIFTFVKLVEGEISEVPVKIRTHGFVQATRIEENIYGQFYIGQSVKNYRKNQE